MVYEIPKNRISIVELRLGTCGWSFQDWHGPFYPPDTQDELAHYATQFTAVEIDSTWYHIPSEKAVKSWHRRTPEDFLFCPKLPGDITHQKLLGDVQDLTTQFLKTISHLKEKLGCIVVQSKGHTPCTTISFISLLKNDNHIPEPSPAPQENAPPTLFD